MSMSRGTPLSSQIVWFEQRVKDLEVKNELLQKDIEMYAAEMSEARDDGFYFASELYDAYKKLLAKFERHQKLAACGTVQNWLECSDEEKALSFSMFMESDSQKTRILREQDEKLDAIKKILKGNNNLED